MRYCSYCKLRFIPSRSNLVPVICPVCHSPEFCREVSPEPEMGRNFEQGAVAVGILSDAMAVDSLRRCGVDWPDIFNLVWGVDPKALNAFPKEHRMIVSDILSEMTKEEESDDYVDKKLHHIIVELLYFAYEKQVCDYVESETKKMDAANNRGR